MELKINIPFHDLLRLIRQLSPDEKALVQQELAAQMSSPAPQKRLTALLLSGPTLTDEQVATLDETRKSLNEWRTNH